MRHQTISFIKSALRLFGYAVLFGPPYTHLPIAATILTISELVGIAEEIGHD